MDEFLAYVGNLFDLSGERDLTASRRSIPQCAAAPDEPANSALAAIVTAAAPGLFEITAYGNRSCGRLSAGCTVTFFGTRRP
ncbi:hypothetical protein [Paraburkholderia sp. 32]|uniref:hypothetical protein n=1 Tax=unclassified Paraburkholderia TaxID=2615204 RepID=UPI003D22343C